LDRSEKAHGLSPQSTPLAKLDAGIQQSLSAIVESARQQLNAYHTALAASAAGYVHLKNAQTIADIVGVIDPAFKPYQELQADISRDQNSFQSDLRTAESARASKQFDQALEKIRPYFAFADEEPRLAAIISDDYNDHMAKGKDAEAAQKWKVAIAEYEKAGKAKASPEAADSLKHARQQLTMTEDKDTVDKALASSKEYEEAHDILRAYEVLESLPPALKPKVSADLDRLQPAYIQSSSDKAKQLRQAHDPIRGLADEVEIEKAYKYLQHAYELSNNDSYLDRMALLANDLSNYLLETAKHYLAKPAGSGAELGWMYLTEALPYKASNLGEVRDTMVAASAAHAIRSKLSIRVQFRDQTSQRDSAGFAGQVENAIITGLEGSGIPVKVVRAGETTPVEPDFQLTGDVIQHHLSSAPTVESMESTYRASEREVTSDAWNKANHAYEKAQMDLNAAQAALQGGESAKGDKKRIKELNQAVQDAEKTVEDAHVQLDATPHTVTQDVDRPYAYTKRTINLNGSIQLQFRVEDTFSGQTAELVPTNKEIHKQFVLLENVKPEDTMGVKAAGSLPDEGEFLTELESSALEALVKAVRERVEQLPKKIYVQAVSREKDSDLDGAGESYLRFLNCVRGEDSPEQMHARKFLDEQFNMHPVVANAQ
jgi:tetratricopeptide (TPR) repeat protein